MPSCAPKRQRQLLEYAWYEQCEGRNRPELIVAVLALLRPPLALALRAFARRRDSRFTTTQCTTLRTRTNASSPPAAISPTERLISPRCGVISGAPP